ncbi:telomeric repeat-binding factor 1 [Pelmatolapia mariae]|uniref:telomeric repeat-binding factor 1 n=1 Tax=Pelmatolapia mariae TaxID=158779 RepID=UPI002FE5FF24
MAAENNNRTASDANNHDEGVSFSHITAVATGWMSDFMFLSLCRRFKEGKRDEFNETLSAFQTIQKLSVKRNEKAKICDFLARVMHGKLLDVQFEDDASVMPLMSAARLWSDLKNTVADESLFKNVAILLIVQSAAVCLEKGERSSASSALRWFENNLELPQGLRVKLSKIVAQKETYHPFLMSFSFSRLLETVQSYLDAYLEKNPSDYLLKAASKMVQSSHKTEGLEDEGSRDSSLSKKASDVTEDRKKGNTTCHRPKRKLLSTINTDVWKPDTCKKRHFSLRRISSNASELSQMTENSPTTKKVQKTRKPPQKWTSQLDKYLKDGVKRHGQGKWSRILMDYDFEGRTGTMLKDRWRVLMRAHEVG